MPTFQFNKLVRDKLPTHYRQLEQVITFKKLSGLKLLQALRNKLIEETTELPFEDKNRDTLIEELSDVEQVLNDIKTELNISDEEVEAARQKKFSKKGGFLDGIFVELITLADDDEWVSYYRAEPEKYPEIRENGKVDPDLPTIEKGIYRHTKSGNLYEVIGVTFHTESYEPLVIYRPLYKSKYELFARPYAMFRETVELNGEMKPRFEKAD